jgi:hypothetical protein
VGEEVIHRSSCHECGAQSAAPSLEASGIDPLFDLRLAAYLIPMRVDTLKKWLTRHKELFPPLYRLQGRMHRRIRLLSGREIRLIRSMALRGKSAERALDIAAGAIVDGLINMPKTVEPSCVVECPSEANPPPVDDELEQQLRELGEEPAGETEESDR